MNIKSGTCIFTSGFISLMNIKSGTCIFTSGSATGENTTLVFMSDIKIDLTLKSQISQNNTSESLYISSCILQPLFAFELKEDYGIDGWTVYDPEAEFRRQVRNYAFIK